MMKRFPRFMRIFMHLLLCLALALPLSGCVGNAIRENETYEALPQIDPEDGVAREIEAPLYFRLGGEPCLLEIRRTAEVRANERAETAVMRALLAGPPTLYNDLTPVFPEGTRMVSLSLDGGILYVTMSREFLHPMPGAKTREQIDLARRLSVYAIVNSLMDVGNADSVLLLIDLTDTGVAARVQRGMLGFTGAGDADNKMIEPMRFERSVVADAGRIAGFALEHIRLGEYERAYAYLAEGGDGAPEKPGYARFEADLMALGELKEYEIRSFSQAEDAKSAEARADLVFRYKADGAEKKRTDAAIQLQWEGEMFKVRYDSLWALLRG